MVRAFWQVADDSRDLAIEDQPGIVAGFDSVQNRPIAPVPYLVALAITPNNVDSFLWLALVYRLATAAVLCMFLRELYRRRSYTISILAALLFIINPSDATRFIAIV